MVLPDGASSQQRDRSTRRSTGALGLAAIGLISGVVVLSLLTSPEPAPSTESLSTSLTSLDSSTPVWDRVGTVPDTAPYAVIHHDDQILLFTSTPPVQRQTLTGLQVWRSADGLEWEPLGTVIEEGSQIDYVTSTALGLVAIGSAGHDERVRVWLSADGVEWLALMDGVPIDTSGLVPLPDTNSVAGEGDMMTEGIEAAIGSDGQVILTELSGERAFALVARPPDRNRPFDIATFEIWTAGLTE